MNAKELKDEILAHYLDKDLQVTVDRDPGKWTTANGLLHTSLAYSLFSLNGLIEATDIQRFTQCVSMCWQPPLVRNFNRTDLEAQDDYHIATASFLLKTAHAEWIALWGESHCWSYNNQNPEHFSLGTCHYRFPGLVAYYQLAGGRNVSWMQGVLLRSGLFNGPSDHSDQAIMEWLKVQVMKKYDKYKPAAVEWECKAKTKWGSLGNICKGYFGETHPFAQIPTIEGIFS